jgi:hypothetical protein
VAHASEVRDSIDKNELFSSTIIFDEYLVFLTHTLEKVVKLQDVDKDVVEAMGLLIEKKITAGAGPKKDNFICRQASNLLLREDFAKIEGVRGPYKIKPLRKEIPRVFNGE